MDGSNKRTPCQFTRNPNTLEEANLGSGMHAGHQFRMSPIILVILQQQLPRVLIQRGLGVGVYQKTFNGHEDMPDPVLLLPILLQRVHADLPFRTDVWVEDLGHEPTCPHTLVGGESQGDGRGLTFGWAGGEVLVELELDAEVTSFVRCAIWGWR